jgi:hypothetical protein
MNKTYVSFSIMLNKKTSHVVYTICQSEGGLFNISSESKFQYSWLPETSCYIAAGFSKGAGLFNYLSQLHLATKQINHFICVFHLSTPLLF